ncbi:hypothetical protein J6590_061207 [Homalodisca vitripennis]|nr:hypothetical protein J6590_061207 [Homalodisca vitripennis]
MRSAGAPIVSIGPNLRRAISDQSNKAVPSLVFLSQTITGLCSLACDPCKASEPVPSLVFLSQTNKGLCRLHSDTLISSARPQSLSPLLVFLSQTNKGLCRLHADTLFSSAGLRACPLACVPVTNKGLCRPYADALMSSATPQDLSPRTVWRSDRSRDTHKGRYFGNSIRPVAEALSTVRARIAGARGLWLTADFPPARAECWTGRVRVVLVKTVTRVCPPLPQPKAARTRIALMAQTGRVLSIRARRLR